MHEKTLRKAADRRGILVGAACVPDLIENDKAYRETLAREFNCIVAENCMKFMYLQPECGSFHFSDGDRLAAFARENKMTLRGHTLAWHNQLPEWLKNSSCSKTEALEILRSHIFNVVGHFRGAVACWDVVNEALSDEGGWREKSPWFQMTGKDYLECAFRWAHEADPSARLIYNDYGMEQPNAKSDACFALMKELLKRGVPVHGVGFQYHLGVENHLDFESCVANLRRFAELGLEIQFTEMDMGIKKPITDQLRQEQAAEYANRVRIALASKATSLIFWGFTDRHTWIPSFTKGEYDEPLLFDTEYRPKPAFNAIWKELQPAGWRCMKS